MSVVEEGWSDRGRYQGQGEREAPIKGADEIHYARKTLQITKFLHGGKQNEQICIYEGALRKKQDFSLNSSLICAILKTYSGKQSNKYS